MSENFECNNWLKRELFILVSITWFSSSKSLDCCLLLLAHPFTFDNNKTNKMYVDNIHILFMKKFHFSYKYIYIKIMFSIVNMGLIWSGCDFDLTTKLFVKYHSAMW